MVNSKNCKTCGNNTRFDSSKSSTFHSESADVSLNYLGDNIHGLESYDKIILKDNLHLTNFGFVLVTANSIPNTMDGMLTLNKIAYSDFSNSFNLIDYLYENHQIYKKVFSIVKNNTSPDLPTKMVIGDVPLKFNNKTYTTYCNSFKYKYTEYWACTLTYIMFDNTTASILDPTNNSNRGVTLINRKDYNFNKNAASINSVAIFETGIDNIIAPLKFYPLFDQYLNFNDNCINTTDTFNTIALYCKESVKQFNSINLVFNGIAYVIPVQNFYELDNKLTNKLKDFIYKFKIIFDRTANNFIIGQILLKNYDLLFNRVNNTISFYKNINSSSVFRLNFTSYTKDPLEKEPFNWSWIVVIVNLLLFVLLGVIINWWMERGKRKEMQRKENIQLMEYNHYK